jgi:hypothetical protein
MLSRAFTRSALRRITSDMASLLKIAKHKNSMYVPPVT